MKRLLQDVVLLTASVVLAWSIVHFGLVDHALEAAGDGVLAGSFLAGLFFTSVLTTAPAIVVLGELALHGNIVAVSLIGGLGAVLGDYLIFAFVRDRVSGDIAKLMRTKGWRKFAIIHKHPTFRRRVLPLLGALCIASPLPDELGLALLGIAHLKTKKFVILSYCMHSSGILIFSLIARAAAGQ